MSLCLLHSHLVALTLFLTFLAVDYRIMRSDYGFVCVVCSLFLSRNKLKLIVLIFHIISPVYLLSPFSQKKNEVDFHAPIPPGMIALLRTKMQPHTFRDAILLGRRFGGSEALEHHIVDEIVKGSEEEVLKQAVAMAINVAGKAKSGAIAYQIMKEEVSVN